MLAEELVTLLNCHRRTTDLADAVLVFAVRKHRLAEAEELICAGSEHMDMLRDEIRACEAQIHQAANTEEVLRTEICALQQPRAADAKGARGMALESVGAASRSRLVVVASSPHKTSVQVRACATTLVSTLCLPGAWSSAMIMFV
jgi:hypothetical protein